LDCLPGAGNEKGGQLKIPDLGKKTNRKRKIGNIYGSRGGRGGKKGRVRGLKEKKTKGNLFALSLGGLKVGGGRRVLSYPLNKKEREMEKDGIQNVLHHAVNPFRLINGPERKMSSNPDALDLGQKRKEKRNILPRAGLKIEARVWKGGEGGA